MNTNRKQRLLRLTAVLLIVGFAACAGSTKRKEMTDQEADIKLELSYGHLLAMEIIKKYPLLHDDKVVRYINKIGKSVALFAGRSDFDYYFAVLDSDTVNAFATPGGYVFITKGAIKNAQNEAELAGVLAHEIAHINLKQIMRDVPPPREKVNIADLIAAFLVSQGATASAAMNETVGKATELLFSKGYRFSDEYDADQNAINYVTETGYYPAGLRDYLARIDQYKKSHNETQVYHTHPPFSDRIARLDKQLKDGYAMNKPKNQERFASETRSLK